ncbi:carbohydrate ABC transporter permease [Actinopolymorpha pittospori]|uniref:Multiple sugar transport system permease protein n=1 Tax=Actinopolymorpha pittospori TaxID=648752 RepID=A0A927MWC8_9ACTN|nr:carbohydrate ABC transporter permease [Actinopolymorpha pittospori]MBE1607824.1 multiple sugar transport system permease protein [Actinopolymorpha pittospori]
MATDLARPSASAGTRPSRGPGRSSARNGERISRGWMVVCTIAVVLASIYFLVPVLWLVIASTKSAGDLFSTSGFAFAGFHLWDNIVNLSTYDHGIFWRWSLNSIIYSVFGSALTTAVCAITGYAIAVYRFRGRRVLLAAVLASMLVPGTVIAQPTYVLLVQMGLNNSYAGLLLPALVYSFGVLLCYIYAQQSVPIELIEAARLDGAGEFRIFASIGVRLMGTGLVTVLLFAFLSSWNSYLLPLLVLTDQHLMPLTVGLTGWNQSAISIPGLQVLTIIGSLISVIPIAIVFVSLQRFWRSGLTAGSLR